MEDIKKLEAMALIVAEHEEMKEMLISMGVICKDSKPLRWEYNNTPIVNLEKTIKDFMKDLNKNISENN